MPSAVGIGGADYLWRDGSTSSLAPPSASIDEVLANPTQWAIENETAISYDSIYTSQPSIGGACRFIAEQVASIPLKNFIRAGEGEDDRTRDHESKFAQALRRPYPRRSSFDLKRDIALDLVVNGNHLEEIVPYKGRIRLRGLEWRKCKPVYNPAKTEIVAWDVWDQENGNPRRLSVFDVIHFKLGNTRGVLGISPLEQLGIMIRIDRAAQAHQLATLRNGGKVGVIVVIDPAAASKPGVVELARAEFEQRFRPQNSGKPYVAAGVDVKTIGQQTLVEAELIEQRKVGREEAAGVLQLPTLFMGDAGKATQNNVGEMHRQLFKVNFAALFKLIPATFDAQLVAEHPDVAPDGAYCEFDPSAILFGDPEERGKAYRELLACGGITVNEIRSAENRPRFDFDWADEPVLPANNLVAAGSSFGELSTALLQSRQTGQPATTPASEGAAAPPVQ